MAGEPIPQDVSRHDVRMDGVYFVRALADAPFVKSLDPGNFSYCVMVRRGRLRLETDFPVNLEVELSAGDAVGISGLAPHTFRSTDGSAASGSDRFDRRDLGQSGGAADVELVLGVAPNEALALGSLVLGPIVVSQQAHPALARRLWRAVEMLEDEYGDDSWIDRNLVVRRMAETMLINMMRRVFADRAAQEDAPSEPDRHRIIQALSAVLLAPERPWSLAELARVAGMSRTRLAEEFKLVTGQTPGRIVSRLRLTAVARRIATAALSVEAAADEAGYSSSAAFVRAFQREFGETPARWRRRRTPRAERTARVRAPGQGPAPRPGPAARDARQGKDAP